MSLGTALLGLRNDPRILRLPPFLAFALITIGIGWLLVLPLNDYSRRTYVSENALLPGQVHTYFGGSEHNVFRAYRQEVAALVDRPREVRTQVLGDILKGHGLKVASQNYSYEAVGTILSGQNLYAILQGPRADATEAIVLMAAWRNMDEVLNQSGVALVLTLARYFKRWSLWSKDIIFLITEDSTAGPQAWVDAYHSTHNPSNVNSLPLVSGALQGALAIDYPAGTGGHRFDKIHVVYDGINGQLPNLDLVNTITTIATGHMGIGTTIQRMWKHDDSYEQRLETMLRGMLVQGMGQASGPHSAFMPYHVDAVTLQTVGDGWQDEMSLGRLVESTVRSLNNLLEHLHQSFFFYLLMNAERFVSIGTYLPSAMMVAVNFAIMAIALWVQSGRPSGMPAAPVPVAVNENGEITVDETKEEKISLEPKDVEVIEHADKLAVIPKAMLATRERHLLFPVVAVCGCHFLGVVPFYIFNNLPASALPTALHLTTFLSLLLPLAAARIYVGLYPDPTTREQPLTLLPTFSLLLLSACLITLSTLNFPLGLFTGLLASPLTLAHSLALRPSPKTTPPPPPPASTPAKLQTAFQLPSPQATATAQASSILAQTPTTQTPHRPSTHERKRTFPALTQITFYILVTISPPFIIYILAALHSASQALTPANLAFHGLSAHTPPSYSQLLRTAEFGSNESVRKFLVQAAQAWSVSGTWTSVVVWVVWWPAWGVGMFCTGVRLWVDFSRRLEDKGMGRR